MEIQTINQLLSEGKVNIPRLFPHLDQLKETPFVFEIDFGLKELPKEPGILLIRGARQYGKSTWLEQQLYQTVSTFGPGSAYYLNGDHLSDADHLEKEIHKLISSFSKDAAIRRLFIDEITAITGWEMTLKRMADQGNLKDILVITTGSKATDLRRASERLPGRKGKLDRTTYLFAPISFQEFKRVCGDVLGEKALITYLLSGGSPIACSELASTGSIPEYIIELVRDWVEGEISASGRNRSSLINILSVLYRMGGTPIGQAKLAREAGLSNNTVAAGYIEILNDLACVIPAFPWDQHRKIMILRKPCKYHFTNVLAAIAYHPANIRSVDDFLELSNHDQAIFYEWLISQEILRRKAIQNEAVLEPLQFWQNKKHEMDFVIPPKSYIEVKRGKSTPIEFGWATHQFPNSDLTVINKSRFQTDRISGITFEDFLLQ